MELIRWDDHEAWECCSRSPYTVNKLWTLMLNPVSGWDFKLFMDRIVIDYLRDTTMHAWEYDGMAITPSSDSKIPDSRLLQFGKNRSKVWVGKRAYHYEYSNRNS